MDTMIVIPKYFFIVRNQLNRGCKSTENFKIMPTKVASRDLSFDESFIVETSIVPTNVLCNLYAVKVLFQAQISRDPWHLILDVLEVLESYKKEAKLEEHNDNLKTNLKVKKYIQSNDKFIKFN